MNKIASLTEQVQQKQSELLTTIENSLNKELQNLEQSTRNACQSVQNELKSVTQTAESFHKTLKTKLFSEDEKANSAMKTVQSFQESLEEELDKTNQMMIQQFQTMAKTFTVAIVLLMLVVLGGTWALVNYYIKPMELKEQLLMRMELEKSGMLIRENGSTYIVIPRETKCTYTTSDNKRACKLPE